MTRSDGFIHLRHPDGRTQRIVRGSKVARDVVASWEARGFKVYEPEAPYDAAAPAKAARTEKQAAKRPKAPRRPNRPAEAPEPPPEGTP